MRSRVAVMGTSPTALEVARRLLARDDCHVLLTGEDAGGLRDDAQALGVEPRVDGPVPLTEITAAAIVVVCEGDGVPVHELGLRTPAALLVVATTHPERDARALQDHLRWPRGRVIGIGAAAAGADPQTRAAAAVQVVDHVLCDRGRRLEATIQVEAEGGGGAGGWASVPVKVGAAGLLPEDR